MVKQFVFEPHYDFYIDKTCKRTIYNMDFFHMHKKYEIYYLTEGSRKYFIDDSIYLVNPGNLVLIDADAVHKTANMGDVPHSRIVINFSQNFIDDFSNELKALELMSIFKTKFTVLPLSFKYKLIIENILSRLVEIGCDEKEPHKVILQLLLSELLIMIKEYIEVVEEKQYESHRIVNTRVDKILKYMSTNYSDELTLTSIAEKFFISPFYLSKIFKKSTNLSIVEYINSLRIREAKELLEHSSLKIADIAEKVGFSSSSHFSRTFKLVTGLAPQQYKKYYSTK